MNSLYRKLERYINQHKKSKVWRRTVLSLACLVVFMTTYALILPAITVDEETANEMSGIAVAEANEELVEVPEAEEEPGVVLIDTAEAEEQAEQSEELTVGEEPDAEFSAEENSTDAEASVPENTAVEEIELVETEDMQTISYQGADYTVTVHYEANAQIPEDAVLSAEEILPETPEYESYYQQASDTDGLAEINFARFFDIQIMSNGEKVEPAAPVQVSIEYADSVSIPEGTKNAIHFKDGGDVELIDAETSQNTELSESNLSEEPTTADAEGNTFTFAQDSFSVTGTVVNAAAAKKPDKSSTMTASTTGVTLKEKETKTVTIECTGCSVEQVTSNDENVATASWNKGTKTITITGVSAGTTTITVTGKANKGYETPKELTINVTVEAAGTAGNSVDLAQRGTSALYSIKGKATAADGKKTNLNSKNKNGLYLTIDAIPEGTTDSDGGSYAEYQKKLEADTGTTEFDFLQFYHIALVDKDGKAVTTSEDDGITYDIEVTFNSGSEMAAWLKENSSADLTLRHYRKESGGVQSKTINDSDSAKVTPVGNSGKYTVNFRIKSFSALGFSHSSEAPDRTSTSTFEYQDNSIMSRIGTVNTDNEWQIFSGEYINNTAGYKTPGDRVRVQKNVIPTGVENEFWMYLGIDINYESILSEQLQTLGIVVGSSFIDDKDIGQANKHQKQDHEAYYDLKESVARGLHPEYDAKWPNKFTVNFYYQGKKYSTTRWCQNSSYNQGYVAMEIGGTWYNIAKSAKGQTGVLDIDLTETSVNTILSKVTSTSIGHVIDTMGTGITAISGSAQTKNGTVSISSDGKTITWDPVATTLGTKSSGWYENAGELIYKIKLDPSVSNGLVKDRTQLATNSNANVATNGSAKLTYTITDNNGIVTTKTQSFTSPVVRGMLYEIKAHKYAKDTNEPLQGAVFGLYSDSACTKKVAEATSSNEADKKGEIDFTGLPWGTYYIKEISAPDGYKKEDTASSAITVCYTTDKAKLTGQGAGEEALYNGSTISFENEKKALNVILRKTDQSGYVGDNTKYLAGATFTITKDEKSAGTLNTSNAQGYLTSEDGIALEDGTYYLTETTPPTGYVAKNFKLTVNSAVPSVTLSIKGEDGQYTDIDITKSVVFNKDKTTATVYITNNPAATLPSTGGSGTLPYTLGGFALIAFSALMYGYRMRRKRERRSM